jgi:hypothetical protein
MKSLLTRRPSPSMVVALVALAVAMSGTAVAATTLVNGDKLIKKHTLSGNRLHNNTVRGTQIKESTLGKVPSATHADSATSASNATHADSATNATNATNATTATTATKANSLPALTWTNLTLQGTTTVYAGGAYGTPSYTKDAQGFVHLSGALVQAANGAQIATLPAGFRPTRSNNTWLRAAATNGASNPFLVDIYVDSTTGNMYVEFGTGANGAFIGLEGVSFYAG